MLERNVVSELTQAEMSAYTGPINYITHHDVYKPGSLSTPVCLVSNSSFKNGSTNLNDITIKGPNKLADIYNNMFEFRSYQVALVFDSTKAYNPSRQAWWNIIFEDSGSGRIQLQMTGQHMVSTVSNLVTDQLQLWWQSPWRKQLKPSRMSPRI